MPDLTWQALYRAALAEPDHIRLNNRIEAARRSIRQRLEQVEDSDTRERQQLDDALGALHPGGKKAICLSSFSQPASRQHGCDAAAVRGVSGSSNSSTTVSCARRAKVLTH